VNQRAKTVGRLAVWAALIAAIDQGIKGLVVATLTPLPDKSLVLLPGMLSLTYRENTGAAFSLLYGTHIAMLVALNLLVLAFFLYLIRPYLAMRTGRFAAAMVLGGAVGNLIDRIFRGYVVDYISFYVSPRLHWPVFNLADTVVVIGVVALVLLVLQSGFVKPVESESEPGRPST